MIRRWPRRIPRPKLLAAAAALFVLYLVLAGYALPRYMEGAFPEFAASELKRKASVGEVSFHPLLFKLEITDFALAEADDRPIARFRRLLVDFELSSVWRWAWTFSTIALDGFEMFADIAPDGRFNIAELVASLPKGASEGDPGAPPPRLILQHIEITDAALTFSDRSGARPRFDSVRPLALELRDITTLADRKGPYSVTARLPAGATLAWRGEMSLRPVLSLGELSLRALRPASVWRFIQDEMRLAEPAGELDVDIRYRAGYEKGMAELTVEDLRVAVRDVAITQQDEKEPFFSLKSASLAGGRFDLARRELVVPAVELRGGVVRVEADADGVLNVQKLAVDAKAPSGERPPPGERPWRVKLESVRLGEIALQFRDLGRAAPLALGVAALDASLSAQLEAGAGDAQATVGDIEVKLSRVSAGDARVAEPLAGLDGVALEGGSFDLRGQRVAARRLVVTGGSVRVVRSADGALPLLELLRTNIDKPAAKPAGATPWRFALDAFEIGALKIALADHASAPPVAYDVDSLTATVKNIRNEGDAPITLDAALRIAQGGTLRVSGEANPEGTRASAEATLARLSLKPLQPLVAARTALALGSGDVSAAIRAQYHMVKERAEVRAHGSARVNDLLLTEAAGGRPLLGWKSVAANGIALSLAPDRLAIADIAVGGLFAKVVVNKDRSVNLVQALTPPSKVAKPAPIAPATPIEPAAPFPIAIERVRLDKAAVDFSDLSLVLPFAANIQDFNGDLLGLSTDRASRAVAKFEGRVDEFGLARVDGSLAPFEPTSFLDLSVGFRNVEMPPLSPYSATFAGRRIASGRLGLDLKYKVDRGALAGENKVELDKFTLGERIEAPGALNLPLDLAVALLTDSQGRISVAMPVTGNVDDPKFGYGQVIWQAVVTVLTNIVTAPFRALFGGGGDEVQNIAFDPGRAALLPPEREKLKRLAEALAKRPQLKVLIEGQYGEADLPALRRREVAVAISARLERAAEGEEPQPVNVRDARTQRALERLFIERASEKSFADLVEQTGEARGKPVERVNPLLAFAGRASDDGEFYDALLSRLVETAPLPADALAKLAAARGSVVAEHLVKALAVPPERVATKQDGAAEDGRAKLALDVAN
jgi:hypothetical protein